MVILHIACIDNSPFSGVSVAVPQHVKAQSKRETVGFINANGVKCESLDNQIAYEKNFDVKKLPAPFDKPDIVIFHEVYCVEYLKICRNLLKNKIPYVIIAHGELRTEAQKHKWLKKTVANILLFNWFVSHAAAVQCLSQIEMDATSFGKRRFVGANGVELPENKKCGFRKEGTHFVYVGRLDSQVKGLDLMLEAVRINADSMRQSNCRLDMYGPDWAGRAAFVEGMICEKEIGDIVSLNPPVRGEEKESILLDGDIFIQTSRHEGMPMGILEALSYGIPCLITRGTNLGEIVENADAGWMAETDAESIAEKMEQAILERVRWEQKGEKARELIRATYTWETVTEQMINQYKQLTKV